MPEFKKIAVSSAVFFLLIVLFCGFAYADPGMTGQVNVKALNIRENPSTDARVLETIPEGTQVEVLSNSGNWTNIRYGSVTGWVFGDYIIVKSTPAPQADTNSTKADTNSTKTGVVSANLLNVRADAGADSNLVKQLEKGTQVTVLSTSNGWHNISFSGGKGWVSSEYISFTDIDIGTGIVTGTVVNVRSGPGTGNSIVTTVKASDKVTVKARSEGWYKIATPAGVTGWITSEYLDFGNSTTSRGGSGATRDSAPVVKAEESTDTRTNLVAYAKKFLGTAYIYGGSSPSKGFDCSGFVQYVFKNFGITLNRVAADQGNQGTKISKSELKPGDLVFFDTNGGKNYINHVGIYIGNGKFIHAANKKSGLVITDLSSSFYAKSYMRSRRILK